MARQKKEKNGLYRKIYDLQTAGIDESEAGI